MSQERVTDAAFDLLPAWVPVVRLAAACGFTLFFSLVATWLAFRLAPKDPGEEMHWTERARTLASATRTMLGAFVFGGVVAAGIGAALTVSPPPFPAETLVIVGIAVAFGVFHVAMPRVHAPYFARPSAATRRRNTGCVLLLMFPHLIILLAAAAVVPKSGPAALIAAILVMALFLAFGLGAGYFVARALGLVRPATERLERLAAVAAERTGCRPREVAIGRSSRANAYAFPPLQRVLVTERALEVLDDEQITAILCHEFGHLTESRGTRVVRLAGVMCVLPLALWRPVYHLWGLLGFAVSYAVLMLAFLVIARVSRRMERRADTIAGEHAEDPRDYARALEVIYRDSLIPAVLAGRMQTHPSLYDRMVGAGLTPDYPRPAPPSKKRARILIVIVVLLNLGSWIGIVIGRVSLVPRTETATVWSVAILGAHDSDFANLSMTRLAAGDPAAAVTFAHAAIAERGGRIGHRYRLIEALAAAGRTDEAEAAFREIDEWIGRIFDRESADETRAWLRRLIDAGDGDRPGPARGTGR